MAVCGDLRCTRRSGTGATRHRPGGSVTDRSDRPNRATRRRGHRVLAASAAVAAGLGTAVMLTPPVALASTAGTSATPVAAAAAALPAGSAGLRSLGITTAVRDLLV